MELTSPPPASPLPPVMPALAGGTHAHLHTVHSALESLEALGVSAGRITLRRAGRSGAAQGTIVRQRPAPGEPLAPGTRIELDIAGLGFNQALPVGLWDSGGEAEAGTRELLEPFDDPLEKLKHWFREGAPLFRLAPDDPAACARWLALFGIDAREWPRSLWFRLASVIGRMPQLSCSLEGCAFVLDVLLGLPVKSFSYHPNINELPRQALSGLGAQSSRLGIDLVAGAYAEDLALLEVELGPVAMSAYERFAETEQGTALLKRTLGLLMPVSQPYRLRWSVLDASRPPRLGIAGENSRLGINTHMGRPLATPSSEGVIEARSESATASGRPA